jgi:hypothetical protein
MWYVEKENTRRVKLVRGYLLMVVNGGRWREAGMT